MRDKEARKRIAALESDFRRLFLLMSGAPPDPDDADGAAHPVEKGINRIPRRESAALLEASGMLFEINRRILHPLGFALEVEVDDDGNVVRLGGLWDYRDDREGMLFSNEFLIEGCEKIDRFMNAFGADKIAEREESLGYIVQPLPDADPDKS